MIKVHKDLKDIPKTLIKGTTLSKRRGVIRGKKFPKVKDYETRFKTPDIKKALKSIYNNKCVYCEQEVISGTVLKDNKSTIEHYRPKQKYYWVAYSWDNLLWCCYGCNDSKRDKFDVLNTLGTFNEKTFLKLTRIHNTAKIYNKIEKPLMIHPELESVRDKLSFVDGIIDSVDTRVKYTITVCSIDRKVLNEKRMTVLKEFKDKVNERILKDVSYDDIVKELLRDIKDVTKEFRALRYWIYKNRESLVKGA